WVSPVINRRDPRGDAFEVFVRLGDQFLTVIFCCHGSSFLLSQSYDRADCSFRPGRGTGRPSRTAYRTAGVLRISANSMRTRAAIEGMQAVAVKGCGVVAGGCQAPAFPIEKVEVGSAEVGEVEVAVGGSPGHW